MKKIFAIMLAVLLCMSLYGCGSSSQENNTPEEEIITPSIDFDKYLDIEKGEVYTMEEDGTFTKYLGGQDSSSNWKYDIDDFEGSRAENEVKWDAKYMDNLIITRGKIVSIESLNGGQIGLNPEPGFLLSQGYDISRVPSSITILLDPQVVLDFDLDLKDEVIVCAKVKSNFNNKNLEAEFVDLKVLQKEQE